MISSCSILLALLLPGHPTGVASQASDTATAAYRDSLVVSRIIEEATTRSQVMELLSWLTDVHGPRLTWSPGYRRAMQWAEQTLSSWGLSNVHHESWTPLGRGWTLERYSANVLTSQPFPLLSYPRAWSPGTRGTLTADVIFFDAATDSALEAYRGRLKGKIVLLGDPPTVSARFEPLASRTSDSTLLALANAEPSPPRSRRFGRRSENMQRFILANQKLRLCIDEGAAAILTPSRGDGGVIFVQGMSVPVPPDSPMTSWPRVFEMNMDGVPPEIVVAAEHYNRIVRMLGKGEAVRIELNLQVRSTPPDSGFNVLAEIPGTDLADEVVMVGGHLDSGHGGTGATDNGSGVATSMEALRILKTLGVRPRRTIRIGLWGGEEQGLFGSRAYVQRHFVSGSEPVSWRRRSGPPPTLSPEGEKFCCYFNNDNGTGQIRGVYLQGQEELRPIFRSWLAPFGEMGASTLTSRSTGSTDHTSFTAVGLPGFQFIQDEIEYFTRTWHSTMDVYDRAQEDDLKQAAAIMAAFVYQAAMRDELLPRPETRRNVQGSD